MDLKPPQPNPALKRTAAPPLSFALDRASEFVFRRARWQDSGDIILPSTSRTGIASASGFLPVASVLFERFRLWQGAFLAASCNARSWRCSTVNGLGTVILFRF